MSIIASGNVGWNQMNPWVKFYEDVMGFRNILSFDDKDISTEYSALMSKVMSNGNGFVKFPINEPAEGKKKSQVEEYLDFYNGEGVQHVAIATNDIVKTVTELQKRGVEFLNIPTTYYETVLDRVGHIDEDLEPLKRLGILVDRDNEGYLLQIFTKPVEDRPTLVFRNHSAQRRARVSAKEISRRFLKPWNGKEQGTTRATSIRKGDDMPYYQKLGEMPKKHHIWFHRNGAGPSYKNEGIDYEHVFTTEGFNEAYSIMYHLRPPTRVRNVKLIKY